MSVPITAFDVKVCVLIVQDGTNNGDDLSKKELKKSR